MSFRKDKVIIHWYRALVFRFQHIQLPVYVIKHGRKKRGFKSPCISFSDGVQNRNYSADVIYPSSATERRFVRVILPAFLRNANFGGFTPKCLPLTHPLYLFERRDEITCICLTKLWGKKFFLETRSSRPQGRNLIPPPSSPILNS